MTIRTSFVFVSFFLQPEASLSTVSLSRISASSPNLSSSSSSHCFLNDAGSAISTLLAPVSKTYFRTRPASIVFPSPTSSARTIPPVFSAPIAAQKALIWCGFGSIFASSRKWNGKASSSSFLYLLYCSSSRLLSIDFSFVQLCKDAHRYSFCHQRRNCVSYLHKL